MAVRAGGKIGMVRYAGSNVYVPITVPNIDIPVLASVSNNEFTLSYTPSTAGSISIIVTSLAANQPTDAAFDASSEFQPVVANQTYDLIHMSFGDKDKSRVWIQLNTGTQRITTSLTVEYVIDALVSFVGNNF